MKRKVNKEGFWVGIAAIVVSLLVGLVLVMFQRGAPPTSERELDLNGLGEQSQLAMGVDGDRRQSRQSALVFGRENVDELPRTVHLLPRIGSRNRLESRPDAILSASNRLAAAGAASDLSQAMDELLGDGELPVDYLDRMLELVCDSSQDERARDFAVQHLGLYAQALARRGIYDAENRSAAHLRSALTASIRETESIVAAAAFRALADLAAIDAHVDVRDLRCRLMTCAGDGGASAAARIMAVQICGERGIRAAIPTLRKVIGDASAGMPLRMSAEVALHRLETQESYIMPFYSKEGL